MPSRHRFDASRTYRSADKQPDAKEIEVTGGVVTATDQPATRTVQKEAYLADEKLEEAVNLAIALGRPLLLQGEPGCGKTRLAHAVAYALGYPLEECYIKSTTRAQDLLYAYDAVSRLYDSQLGTNAPESRDARMRSTNIANYITLGPLGRAIARASQGRPSVVLIDEIDKADLDFPNDLLRELDELAFDVPDAPALSFRVPRDQPSWRPVIFVTHNEEKALPPAFLRRCIFHYVKFPDDPKRLEEILAAHDPDVPEADRQAAVAELNALRQLSLTKPPGISELIDWVAYVHGRGGGAAEFAKRTALGAALKNMDDQQKALAALEVPKAAAPAPAAAAAGR